MDIQFVVNRSHLSNYHGFSSSSSSSNVPTLTTFRASSQELQPLDDSKNKFYKQLGMFSLRKEIEDSVLRAEILAPTALEVEEAKRVNHEELVREHDLWDDLNKSNEVLTRLADSAKVVDTLRDLKYKVEEARLITELAEMDSINYALFRQAYNASLDINKFLDKYEVSKLLKEPYDMEGACIAVESRLDDISSQKWTGQVMQMYLKWAERQGHKGRVVERLASDNGGLKSVTIEFEFRYAYGHLSGEKGVHSLMKSKNSNSVHPEISSAFVDVVPLFIESSPDLLIPEEDILVSHRKSNKKCWSGVHIQHIPTGLEVQSTSERSRFANKVKALNRLKAKLLIIMEEQGIISTSSDVCNRRYVFSPSMNMVQDVRSGLQVDDVNAVLNGNLEPLIAAQINSRKPLIAS